MSKAGTLMYKCRMCESVFGGDEVENLKDTIYSAALHLSPGIAKTTFTPLRLERPILIAIHSCSNGSVGIADIVGAIPRK